MSYLLLSRASRVGTIGDRGDWLTAGIAAGLRAVPGVAGGLPTTVRDSAFAIPAGAEAAGLDAWFTALTPDFSVGGVDWYGQLLETGRLGDADVGGPSVVFTNVFATENHFILGFPPEAWGAVRNAELAIDDSEAWVLAVFQNIPDVRVKLGSAGIVSNHVASVVIENVQRGQVDASDADGGIGVSLSFVSADTAQQNSFSLIGSPGDDSVHVSAGSLPSLPEGGHTTLFAELGADGDHLWTVGTRTAVVATGGSGDDRFHVGTGEMRLRYRAGDGNDLVFIEEGGRTILEVDVSLRAGASLDSGWWLGGGTLRFVDGGSIRVSGGVAEILWISVDGMVLEEPRRLGSDRLLGDTGANWLQGGAGSDWIGGGDGSDTLVGGAGTDTIHGEGADDSLHGGRDDDLVLGGDDDDILAGGSGDDALYGDHTELDAESGGNDALSGGMGVDSLFGAGGDDVLSGGGDYDELFGGQGNDLLFGGRGDDRLVGDEGDDTLVGGNGFNILEGGDGNDRLLGGNYFNWLTGGEGLDWLRGGAGLDYFLFSYGKFGHDMIVDYNFADGDAVFIDLLPDVADDGLDFSDLARVISGISARRGSLIIDFEAGDRLVFRNIIPTGVTVDITDLPDILSLQIF